MLQINVHDPKIKLSDLIEAAEKGEEILITTDNKKIYKIIEVEKPKRRGNAGSAKGMIEIADDFDLPLKAFKDYMPSDQPKQEAVQLEQRRAGLPYLMILTITCN